MRLRALQAQERYQSDPALQHTSADPVTEERFQRLKHAPRDLESMSSKVKRWWGRTFTTAPELKGNDVVFEGIDPTTGEKMYQSRTAYYAHAVDRRRLANALHRNILVKMSGVMHDITATLKNPQHYELFARKIFADEAVEAHARNRQALENEANLAEATALLREAKQSGKPEFVRAATDAYNEAQATFKDGPKYEHRELGETEAAALKEQADIDKLMAQSPGVQSAYERHLEVMHGMRDEMIARGIIAPTSREFYFPHYIVDFMQEQAPKNLPRGVGLSKSKSANTKARIGGREWSRDYMTAVSTYLTRNMEMLERHNLLDEIAYRYHVTRNPLMSIREPGRNGKPSDYDLYLEKGVIPRGYTRYTLNSGYTKQRASSPGERLTGELLDNVLPEIAQKFGIKPYVFDQVMGEWRMNPELARNVESRVVGGKVNDAAPQTGTEVVIPSELADELTILAAKDQAKAPLPGTAERGVRAFKTLAIHLRPLQYNVRNLAGDMNRAIAQFGVTPMSDTKLWKEAFHEVGEAMFHRNFIGDWHDAHRYGLLSSGRTATETTQLRDIEQFRKLTGDKPNLNTVKEMSRWLGPHWSQMREDITRLYVYKMNKVRGVDKMLLGAVDPEYIKGLVQAGEPARAYAAIARKSLIDFGDFTPSEDYLRNGLVPFYSWVKGNLTFWGNDLPRAYARAASRLGSKNFSSSDAHLTQGAAVIAGLAATAAAWNQHNDDYTKASERLPEAILQQTHIILPDPAHPEKPWLDGNGRPRLIAIPDALDDGLQAVGMGGMTADLGAYFKGHIGAKELLARRAEAAYKQPVNYAVKSLGPVATALPAIAGVRTYPDIFNVQKVPEEKRLQTALGAVAATNVPGVEQAIDLMPGQVASPVAKTFDFPGQMGLKSVQTTRLPYYTEDAIRAVRQGQSEIADLQGRMRAMAGGLAEPQLTPEQRTARVAQMRRILDIRVAEVRRAAERLKAIRRTQEMTQ